MFKLSVYFGLIGLSFVVCTTQSGCMVGPNFHSPKPPQIKQYAETPVPAQTVHTEGVGGQAQFFDKNKEIPLLWWELFHSNELNELIQLGLANSPTLAAASAALRAAQENWKAQIGLSLLPAMGADMGLERQQYSSQQIGQNTTSTFTLLSPVFSLAYTFDVFGGARRLVEALKAQVAYQQYEETAARLTLTANIAMTVINMASYEEQIAATYQLIAIQGGILHLLTRQYQVGGVSQEHILTQQALLAATEATLPPLEKSLSLATHSLSLLVGTFPAKWSHQKINFKRIQLPTELPLSLPSELVHQRPDILAAEALVHEACAQVGVATANLFPQFTFNGDVGWINGTWQNLFTTANAVWLVSPKIAQSVFMGNALRAKRRAAIANLQQSSAQYQQTVLQAFQNVADVLKAIELDARTLKADSKAEEAARASLVLTQKQYRLGGVSYIILLNAQQQYQNARLTRIKAKTNRYTDTVALFQALGGGWWQRA